MTHAITVTLAPYCVLTDTFQRPPVRTISRNLRCWPVCSDSCRHPVGVPGPARQIRTRNRPGPQRSWSLIRTVRRTPEREAIVVASRLEHYGVVTVIAARCSAAGDSVLATTVRCSGVQRHVSARD